MMDIIGMINERNFLAEYSVQFNFDVVNMFPSIGNVSGLEAVS